MNGKLAIHFFLSTFNAIQKNSKKNSNHLSKFWNENGKISEK